MERFILNPKDLRLLLTSLQGAGYELVGPVAKPGGQHAFQVIDDLNDLVLDYVHTILPPKKRLLPPRETLLTFRRDDPGGAKASVEASPQVLVGVHPCDLAGIRHLDLALGNGSTDTNYMSRRRATILIGVDCLPDDSCFCDSVGTLRPRGYDLFLLRQGGHWLLTEGSERGRELRERHAPSLSPAGVEELEAEESHYREKRARQRARLFADAHDLPMIFEGAYQSPVWERVAARCLACGTCTNVCPTCYCFDIQDDVDAELETGERYRTADSCQLRDFTRVAGNEVFREPLSLRVRHRVYRKFRYLHRKFNEPNCTGCGRCSRQCVAGIRMHEIVNELVTSTLSRSGGGRK
jgi:ferredoxin